MRRSERLKTLLIQSDLGLNPGVIDIWPTALPVRPRRRPTKRIVIAKCVEIYGKTTDESTPVQLSQVICIVWTD